MCLLCLSQFPALVLFVLICLSSWRLPWSGRDPCLSICSYEQSLESLVETWCVRIAPPNYQLSVAKTKLSFFLRLFPPKYLPSYFTSFGVSAFAGRISSFPTRAYYALDFNQLHFFFFLSGTWPPSLAMLGGWDSFFLGSKHLYSVQAWGWRTNVRALGVRGRYLKFHTSLNQSRRQLCSTWWLLEMPFISRVCSSRRW